MFELYGVFGYEKRQTDSFSNIRKNLIHVNKM